MKLNLLCTAIVLCSVALMGQQKLSEPIAAKSEGVSKKEYAEFQRLANAWKDAYNNKDGAAIGALYAEDAEYVSPHVATLIAHGRENIRANFQRGMDAGGHIDAVEILSIRASCEMASIVAKYDATNSGQKVSGRNVIVLKKIDGKWLFATHASIVQ